MQKRKIKSTALQSVNPVALDISYFILTVADSDSRRLTMPSALQLAEYRLSRGVWGLKNKTRNRRIFKSGDCVLIYIAGRRELAQHFIAAAHIGGPALPVDTHNQVDAPDLRGSICSEFMIKLLDINRFSKPVHIRSILKKLELIAPHNLNAWRVYLQGGSTHISKRDFVLVESIGNTSHLQLSN